jgi:hypothetical protein
VAKYIAWRSRGITWVENVFLNAWVDLGEGTDRARDRAGRNFVAGGDEPFAGAREFGIGVGQF